MRNRKLAIFLTVIFAIPTTFLLLFTLGEVFSGDLSGFGHLLQAVLFIILIILIWKWPLERKRMKIK